MYQIVADLHTHTMVSNHAFNTITEMAQKAKEIGLQAMAVTDHGCAMPDSPHSWYFYNLLTLPPVLEGIPVLKGIEANVMNKNGGLDVEPSLLNRFDWVIASIHDDCLPGPLLKDEATALWLKVAENPDVDMIGHSEQAQHYYDYRLVTKVFAQRNKVVELNANSFAVRPHGYMRELALACKHSNCPVAINTDAHSIYHLERGVGHIIEMLKEIEFPEQLVVNSDMQRLTNTLALHHRKFTF